MMATGEPQTPAPQLDSLELARLLRRRLAGEAFPHSFIHEADAYSAAPADLVRGREHAPGTGQAGDGKGMAWYFCSTANCHESAGGAPRRNLQVGGGRERRFWHPEGGKKPIPGEAYKRKLSYVLKIKNRRGATKPFRNKRLGWCMLEIGLEQQDGGAGHQHQLVLCKVYRSPRSTADPAETSTTAAGAEDVGPAAGTGISGVEDGQRGSAQEGGAIPEEPLDVYRSPHADAEASVPSGGMPCPTPFECGNQSMELAMEDGRPVIAENSYSHQAPAGTVITRTRDTTKSILTSIELKRTVTILDIERTSTLDQDAFVLVVKAISIFQSFEDLGISVDWVATSEGKMSFTLVPSQLLSQEVIQPALDKAVQKLQKIATVDRLQDRSVISLIGNPQMSIVILGKALDVLGSNNFTVEKVPRGSPKVANVSLVVHDSAAERCVQLLHSAFFELNGCPVPVNSSGAASSSDKRKADDGHPDAPPGVRQERTNTEAERWVLEELERPLLSDNELNEFFDSVFSYNEMPARVDGGDNNCHIPVSEVEGPEKERPIPVDSSTASSSNAEAPPCGGQDAYHIVLPEMEHTFLLSDNNDPMPVGADNVGVQYESINTFWIYCIDGGDLDSERPLPDVLYDDDYAVQNGSDEYSEDCDYFMYDEVQFEEQELTEAEESGSELASVTEEMERSHQESTTNHDGRDLGVLSQSGIWEICGWVHRLATFKPSMPSAGHTNSLCSRLAVWLTRFCAKQNSVE